MKIRKLNTLFVPYTLEITIGTVEDQAEFRELLITARDYADRQHIKPDVLRQPKEVYRFLDTLLDWTCKHVGSK